MVGIFHSVKDPVRIGVGIGGIGDGAGGLAGSVIAEAKRSDSRNRASIFHYGVKRAVHVPDEVRIAVKVGIGGGVGGRVGGGPPTHFESVRKSVPVRIRTGGEAFAVGVVDVDIAIVPTIGGSGGQGFCSCFVRIGETVIIAVQICDP